MYRGGIISLPGKVRKYLLEEMTFEPYVRTDKVDGSLERRHREKRYSRQRCRGLAASKSMRHPGTVRSSVRSLCRVCRR